MAPLLHVSDFTFAYGDRTVLRGVSMSLSAGEVVALIGPNGSGKSTLIKAIVGHLVGTGEMRWMERNVGDWKRRELARQIAYLAQSPTFEPDQPVSEALRLGRAPYWSAFGIESVEDGTMVDAAARELGLTNLLGRPMAELSGGQRQRVFLGRCLVQNPKALLLDEPNTYLDLRHAVELGRLMRGVAREKGIGVLMASHDLNLAAMTADRMILLDRGTVAATGTVDEVLEAKLLSRVYGVEMERFDRPMRPPTVLPVGERADNDSLIG